MTRAALTGLVRGAATAFGTLLTDGSPAGPVTTCRDHRGRLLAAHGPVTALIRGSRIRRTASHRTPGRGFWPRRRPGRRSRRCRGVRYRGMCSLLPGVGRRGRVRAPATSRPLLTVSTRLQSRTDLAGTASAPASTPLRPHRGEGGRQCHTPGCQDPGHRPGRLLRQGLGLRRPRPVHSSGPRHAQQLPRRDHRLHRPALLVPQRGQVRPGGGLVMSWPGGSGRCVGVGR